LERLFIGCSLRALFQRPERLVRELGITAGMRVLDLGAGTGFLVPSLAAAVGPAGHVLALDVSEEYLPLLARRARLGGTANVSVIRATAWELPLARWAPLDYIVALYSLHHFERLQEVFMEAMGALRAGGRFAIIDPIRERLLGHGSRPEEVLALAARAGLRPLWLKRGLLQYSCVLMAPAAATTP